MNAIASLLSRALTLNLQDTLRSTRRNSVLFAFAALMFLTTYAMLLIAAMIWLASHYGIMSAVLILAAVTLVFGLIAILVVLTLRANVERRKRERRNTIEAFALPLISSGLGLVRKRPLVALSLAIAILTAATRSSSDDNEA